VRNRALSVVVCAINPDLTSGCCGAGYHHRGKDQDDDEADALEQREGRQLTRPEEVSPKDGPKDGHNASILFALTSGSIRCLGDAQTSSCCGGPQKRYPVVSIAGRPR
jgi:hypothetical protein